MLSGVTPQWLRWMFGRIAWRYDLTNTMISAGLDEHWRRRLAQQVARYAARDILDVACGTGGVMRQVARCCPEATRIVGVDFTEAMIRVGQTRLQRVAPQHRLNFCVADALCLPYPEHSFDAVTMMFGVRNFAVPLQGLAECYRVLRPGGCVYLVEFAWPPAGLLRSLYSGYFRYLVPLIAWPLSGERTAYRYLRDSVLAFRRQPGVPDLLRQAGFVAVEALPLSGGIAALYEGRKTVPGHHRNLRATDPSDV